MYSALKMQGRRLYELARKGEEVARAARPVTVYHIACLPCDHPRVELEVECSRGTYIRTLVEDIGTALGCGATVEFLSREKVGTFGRESALDGRALRQMAREDVFKRTYSVEEIQRLLPA
jgi:tRNA pseudouridine55 synthase